MPAYCRRLSVNADSEQIGFLVEERFNELCMDFLFWVESDRDFIVTSIDWENTDDAQEAELQIERLLKCGVSEHDAIYRVTQNIFSKYEIYPQSGHAIEIN